MSIATLNLGPVSIDLGEFCKCTGRGIIRLAKSTKKSIAENKKQDILVAIIENFSDESTGKPFICAWCKVHMSKKAFETHIENLNISNLYLISHLNIDSRYIVESYDELNGYEVDTPEWTDFDYILK